MLAIVATAEAGTAPYRLGVGDRLRVSVYDRPDLSGEYPVRPPGILSLPLVGEIAATERTLADLEREISARLRPGVQREGQLVNIEVLAYRPFFILGDVRKPGRYPYEPGLSVFQALAIAGGRKGVEDDALYEQTEVYRAKEKLRQSYVIASQALLRQARFRAEAAAQEGLEVPDELALYLGRDRLAPAVALEQALLDERRRTLEGEVKALELSKEAFREEIRAHQGQMEAETERSEVVGRELSELGDVKDQRLVPTMVLRDLERLSARIEGNKRELEAFIARARQKIEEVDQAILRLRNDRRIEIAAGLNQAAADLAVTRAGIEETRRFLSQVTGLTSQDLAHGETTAGGYAITRPTEDALSRLAAEPDTPVLPGDLITVFPDLGPAGGGHPR